MAISDIVNVVISRQTKTVSRKGFGVELFIGLHKVFNERIRFYSDVDELLADGFKTTSNEYKSALASFSQNPAPQQIAIGRINADSALVSIVTVANSTLYTIKINTTTFSFTSDSSATAAEIIIGLVAAVNGGSEPVTATNNTTTLTLAANVPGTPYTLVLSANLSAVLTANETWGNCIAAIRDVSDEWYGLTTYSHLDADILDIAAYVEATTNEGAKLYGVSSSEAAILTSATTDIASQLSALSYARTWILYNAGAANYPECAWFGNLLPLDPGSATWKFKTLVGQIADDLTTTQINYALGKSCNIYTTNGGVDITEDGTVADKEFIDTIVGVDWLASRIRESIYTLLVNTPKVPYTDQGGTLIQNQIDAQLKQGVAVGFLVQDSDNINVPLVANIDPADKSARLFPGITFSATLAGAIHEIDIKGFVSV